MTYLYKNFILKNAPKVLTQIDRDEHSCTYGCCDRNFWHLKIHDFSSAILQQSGLFLAVIYNLDFEDNIFYHNSNIKRWAEATVYYWAKIQLSDGSFNEYYPWEHGFPPTAFSLYSSCETYRRLKMNDNFIIQKIRKTSKYLISHIETQALNQEIASITALYSSYLILQEDWVREGLEKKLQIVLKKQSEEGWFPEYEGADLGYLSVSLDMLAEYYFLSNDKRVLPSLEKIVSFIQYFVHPNSTIGGEYGSRNTTYFLPCGLQTLANLNNSIAESIINVLYGNTEKELYFLDSVDDRYYSHYLMHSFARALERRKKNLSYKIQLPYLTENETVFKDAALCSVSKKNYFAIISLGKGGIIKVFDKNKEIWLNCGYRINYGNGVVSTTNWLDKTYKTIYDQEKYTVEGYFNKVRLKIPSPILHCGLRIISFFLGNRIIKFLKKQIILVKKHDNVQFKRTIVLSEKQVEITDLIISNQEITLERASNMSLRHVASGKFFSYSDLICNSSSLIKGKKIKIKTEYNIEKKEECIKYEKLY